MERLKMILGFVLLPFAYCLWVVDRIVNTVNPQLEHKKLTDWLTNTSVIYAITRILTILAIRYTIKWIFGV